MTPWRIAWLVATLAGLPLICTGIAPLLDLPSHLARIGIETDLYRGAGFWLAFYHPGSLFGPYAGMDGPILLLHLAGLPLAMAGMLFLLATYMGFLAGFDALCGALGTRDPVKTVLVATLFFNGAFAAGLVCYLAGFALCLGLLAVWLGQTRPWRRHAIALCGTLVLFLFHPLPMLVFLLAICVLEVRAGGFPSAAPAGLLALGLLFAAGHSGGAASMHYSGEPSLAAMAWAKLNGAAHAWVDGSDAVSWAMLAGGLAVLAMAAAVAARWHLSQAGFWIAASLGVVFVLAPSSAGGGNVLDQRLVPLLGVLALVAVRLDWRSQRGTYLSLGIVCLLTSSRAAMTAMAYAREGRVYVDFACAARDVRPDSVVLTAIGTPRKAIPLQVFWSPPTEFLPTLASRDGVFVPTVYAIPTQHPLVLDPAYEPWRQYFDFSTASGLARSLAFMGGVCRAWHAAGHAGTVYVATIYPSVFSDTAAPPGTKRFAGPGFRLGELPGCAAEVDPIRDRPAYP